MKAPSTHLDDMCFQHKIQIYSYPWDKSRLMDFKMSSKVEINQCVLKYRFPNIYTTERI